jgi:hypothetical protein
MPLAISHSSPFRILANSFELPHALDLWCLVIDRSFDHSNLNRQNRGSFLRSSCIPFILYSQHFTL